MNRLYVLFDATCGLCVNCRNWLREQPAFVELTFIPLQSPELEHLFPGIEVFNPKDQLLVISDEGAVYQGPHAWIICLYALKNYREWSQRLAQPALLPFARRAFEMLSQNRLFLSRWFAHESPEALRDHLAAQPGQVCASDGACSRPNPEHRAIAKVNIMPRQLNTRP